MYQKRPSDGPSDRIIGSYVTKNIFSYFYCVAIGSSSRPDGFCENGVLRNFAKFTGKHLCQSLFFNKVAGGEYVRQIDILSMFLSVAY